MNLITTLNHEKNVLYEAHSIVSRHQNTLSPENAKIVLGCLKSVISDYELLIRKELQKEG